MAAPATAAPATAALAVTEAAADFLGVTADAMASVAFVTPLPTPLAAVVVALTAVAPTFLVALTARQQQQQEDEWEEIGKTRHRSSSSGRKGMGQTSPMPQQ